MTEVPTLNLLVLRSPDPARLAVFYARLGIAFTLHRHGSGPEHHAAELGSSVFEIYPAGSAADVTTATRLGFAVGDVDAAVEALSAGGATVVSPPKESPWGRRAVVTDPDGHKVELTAPKKG